MMIRITDTPKPKDRFGSIPIRTGKPTNNFSPGPHPPRRQKPFSLWAWLRRIVGLLLVLALLLGLGSFLLVPYLTTTHLPKQLAAAMNRSVTIARAEFNPLTCTLTLHHLIVGPKLSTPDDPVDPLLSAGRISIGLLPERLLNGELACNLGTEHFFLHLVRQKDGCYNLGQTLDELLPGMPVLPLRFSWNTISASNSRLVFDDAQTGKNHLAEEISLTIPSDQTRSLHLQAKVNGVPITLPDTASPAQASTPPPAKPESAEPEEAASTPAAPDDSTIKTAEAIALVQELSQAARQYRQNPVTPQAEGRTKNPLTP
ncbi:MAG: hypothetical protein NT087_12430 [Deltaproteobacteria bacterium]|nr:hypothetical protein [Deltaproteobacteria bacterium]